MSRTSDPAYKRNRARIRRAGAICAVCGDTINLTLPQYDPMSFQSGHLNAVARGGSNDGELAPMHRNCNLRMATKTLDEVRYNPHSRNHY